MQTYKHFLTSILIVLCYACSDKKASTKTIQQKAIEITNRLDSSSIQIFYKWNFSPRGEGEIWSESHESGFYNLFYMSFPDTLRVYVNGDIPLFLKNYPINLPIDTASCSRILFFKSADENIKIISENNGISNAVGRIKERNLFKVLNPIEEISNLSKLKDSLNVWSIKTNKGLGNFVEFYLTPEDILTYLPNDLVVNPKFKDVWLKEFAKGTTINRNWNLRKKEVPTNGK